MFQVKKCNKSFTALIVYNEELYIKIIQKVSAWHLAGSSAGHGTVTNDADRLSDLYFTFRS